MSCILSILILLFLQVFALKGIYCLPFRVFFHILLMQRYNLNSIILQESDNFKGTILPFYNSAFSSLYKSTGPKCQYMVLAVDSFLYKSIALLLIRRKSALPWQPTAHPQSGKRQHAVEHKEFVAELVAPYALGYCIYGNPYVCTSAQTLVGRTLAKQPEQRTTNCLRHITELYLHDELRRGLHCQHIQTLQNFPKMYV